MSEETNIKLIIRLVYHKAELNPLLEQGFTYSQIGRLLSKTQELGYIDTDNGDLKVTTSGMRFLEKTPGGTSGTDRGWIRPMYEEQIEPLGYDDIYLPSQDTVRALRKLGY